MSQAISPHQARLTLNPMSLPAAARAARKRKDVVKRLACAVIPVSQPPHLCNVQATTRELCRSVGLSESAVFQAVISVTEFAHRLFTARDQAGIIELSAVRRRSGLELEVRAENAGAPGVPAIRVNMTLSLDAAPRYS